MHQHLKKIKHYNRLLSFLDQTKITRHELNLLHVINHFFKEIENDDILSKAQAMAFNFILAIFPGIIFLFTLIPYISFENLRDGIMLFLSESMPASVFDLLSDTINDIVSRPRGGLLSLGFILSLYAAMNGTGSMMNAFNQCYNTTEKRGFVKTKLIAAGITLMLVVLLMVNIVLLNVGEFVLIYLERLHMIEKYVIYLVNIFRYSMLVFMFYIATSVIYYFAPSIHAKWNFFSHGSIIATVINVILSFVFSLYINNFASYNKLYGSIGSIIVMMLWFYMTSLVILIGFEINASIDYVKTIKHHHRAHNV